MLTVKYSQMVVIFRLNISSLTLMISKATCSVSKFRIILIFLAKILPDYIAVSIASILYHFL